MMMMMMMNYTNFNTIKHHQNHFTLGTNSYMFRHNIAIFRGFINDKYRKANTYFRL